MAVLADTNAGFKGQVTSADTPVILGKGSRYSVQGAGHLKVTAGGSGDRAVTVAAGSAWGDGVLSTWESSANLNAPLNGGGNLRWDTVVIRREWTPAGTPTGTATLMILTGGGSRAISTARTVDRGVTTSDQPIALIRINAGAGTVAEVVDLRCWAGDGGLVAAHLDARQYLTDPGTQVRIGGSVWTRIVDNLGALQWSETDVGDAGWSVQSITNSNMSGQYRYRVKNGWMAFQATGSRTSGSLSNADLQLVAFSNTRFRPAVTAYGVAWVGSNSYRMYVNTAGEVHIQPFSINSGQNFQAYLTWPLDA